MLRPLLISCIVAICLLRCISLCYGQERSISPYLGVSAVLDSTGYPGWGIEAGMRFFHFYAGFEYGTYSYPPVEVVYDGPIPNSYESFWGVHGGYVFQHFLSNFDVAYLGIVILNSYRTWNGYATFTKNYLNIGPDFRYAGIDDGHIYLALAYTIRRGLKFGIGYIF
jgi:hypothetical protein